MAGIPISTIAHVTNAIGLAEQDRRTVLLTP
jgi:hypothetical protein